MENGEWEFPSLSACGKNLCSIHTLGFEVRFLIHHALFVVWIPGERNNPRWKLVKPFTRSFLHSPFSNLWEWALHHSRRACHIPIPHSPRMGRKRCDNPYWSSRESPCTLCTDYWFPRLRNLAVQFNSEPNLHGGCLGRERHTTYERSYLSFILSFIQRERFEIVCSSERGDPTFNVKLAEWNR